MSSRGSRRDGQGPVLESVAIVPLGLGPTRHYVMTFVSNVCSRRDSVAKLDEDQLARNIRLEAREFLSQHCALALGLESILRAGPLKIVLQPNRRNCRRDVLALSLTGWGP
jgi:hypothetical protein